MPSTTRTVRITTTVGPHPRPLRGHMPSTTRTVRTRRRACAAAAVALGLLHLSAAPAMSGHTTSAEQPSSHDGGDAVAPVALRSMEEGPDRVTPAFPGLDREGWELGVDEPVQAQVLAVEPDAGLGVRVHLAGDRVPGLETVAATGRRLLAGGGVAGINGGFWMSQPAGDPNGYAVVDGRLVSEAETQADGPRGTLGITAAGEILIDRLDTAVRARAGAETVTIDGVNRLDRGGEDTPYPDGPDAVYAFTPAYGDAVKLPRPQDGDAHRGDAWVVPVAGGTAIPASGTSAPGTSISPYPVQGGTVTIPPDGFVLVGYGEGGQALSAVDAADPLTVEVGVSVQGSPDGWGELTYALAAGPLLVADGRRTTAQEWRHEGFGTGHTGPAAPRSAIGVTATGEVLLATVDGRQPDTSVGMSMEQLTDFLVARGAVSALALDGGGSTTMVVDGLPVNRVSNGQRAVATSLFVHHDYPFDGTDRVAGTGRVETAAEAARAGHPDGAAHVLLAPAGDFPDALAGGPLASAVQGPLLLTGPDELPEATAEVLEELSPERVTLLGGAAVLSRDVADELRDLGFRVDRLAGTGRFETAAEIAKPFGRVDRVVLASGEGFADALSVAAVAGEAGIPILLTGGDRLPPVTARTIRATQASEVVIVGGTDAVSAIVERQVERLSTAPDVIRLAGDSRFGTARAVNEWAAVELGLTPSSLVIADGGDFPDALAGGPLATARGELLMIVPGPDITRSPDALAYLEELEGVDHLTLLGGPGALSSFQRWQLEDLVLSP